MYGYDFQPSSSNTREPSTLDQIMTMFGGAHRGVNNAPPTAPLAIEELDWIHFDERALSRTFVFEHLLTK